MQGLFPLREHFLLHSECLGLCLQQMSLHQCQLLYVPVIALNHLLNYIFALKPLQYIMLFPP